MKQANSSKSIIKFVIFLVACAAFIGLGFATGIFSSFGNVFQGIKLNWSSLVKLLVMIALVLAIEHLVLFILGLLKPEKGRAQTLLSLLTNAIKYITAIVILCWGLSILGANVGTIVAGVGIVTLIVGFGANSLIADLVTGIFMIFENQYNVGDFIEVGGFRGKVTSIGIRTTCLEDAGGNIKIVNNSDMSNILNRSDPTSRAVSVIGIPYETDLEALEAKLPEMLMGMYQRHQDIFLAPPVYLGVDELADSSVNLKFVVEVHDASIYAAGRALNRELFLCLKKVGVEVPFPQVDVHQK